MLETKVDPVLLTNIFTDGIDWSCRGFWGQINVFKWEWWYKKDPNAFEGLDTNTLADDITLDTVLMQMRDDEDGEAETEDREWTDITLRKLDEATQWALENYNHLFGSYTVNKEKITDIDYDAIGADIILQKIVLGDVIYG